MKKLSHAPAGGDVTAKSRPDVFIAEPVGSGTDLMATVVLPIQQIYAGPLEMAPMPVLVDAGRLAAAVLSRPLRWEASSTHDGQLSATSASPSRAS